MVGHVEELELVGSGGEGGAHDEVHLHLQDLLFLINILYLLCSSLTVGNIVPSELSWERSCLKEAFFSKMPGTSKSPVSRVVLRVQAGEKRVVGLLDRLVQGLVGHHDPLPLLVHVAAQLLEEGAEENDAVSQRVLQLSDRHQGSLQLFGPLVI